MSPIVGGSRLLRYQSGVSQKLACRYHLSLRLRVYLCCLYVCLSSSPRACVRACERGVLVRVLDPPRELPVPPDHCSSARLLTAVVLRCGWVVFAPPGVADALEPRAGPRDGPGRVRLPRALCDQPPLARGALDAQRAHPGGRNGAARAARQDLPVRE
jgi:hypothetical protein